jgi:hypothetical protein
LLIRRRLIRKDVQNVALENKPYGLIEDAVEHPIFRDPPAMAATFKAINSRTPRKDNGIPRDPQNGIVVSRKQI